jgi:hypothetical protein
LDDPFKLQKQVNFLETNEHIHGCFHDVIVVDEKSNVINENYIHHQRIFFNQVDSLVYGGAYCTGSLVFRSKVLKDAPDWFLKSPSDYAIDLLRQNLVI